MINIFGSKKKEETMTGCLHDAMGFFFLFMFLIMLLVLLGLNALFGGGN